MTLPTASVIICTRNRRDALVACLRSIAEQSHSAEQIIVVDGSDEATDAGWLRQRAAIGGGTELVYRHVEPCLTRQRNIGARQAGGEVLFYFDDDVELDSEYLANMLYAFRSHPQHGGGMGSLSEPRSPRFGATALFRRLFMLTRRSSHGRLQPSGLPTYVHNEEAGRDVEVLSGAAMAYRSWVLGEISFDEALAGYGYMEDVDFSYRVSRLAPLFYEPAARAQHHSEAESPAASAARRRMLAINHHYLFFKNVYPACRLCVLAYLWSVVGMILLAMLARRWRGVAGYLRGLRDIAVARAMGHSVLEA
jgi:GT2 family glycosyltransferase